MATARVGAGQPVLCRARVGAGLLGTPPPGPRHLIAEKGRGEELRLGIGAV